MSDTSINNTLRNLTDRYAPKTLKSNGASSTDGYSPTPYTGKNGDLDMTDFLYLMVKQFQNQTIDDTASTADMMNQLVQMSVMQAVSNVTDAVNVLTDASTLTYASSLVGKEVTFGEYDKDGKITEVVGTITGTGTYNGQQVVFVGDKSYALNQIMAIGRLPDIPEEETGGGENGGGETNPPDTKE